jgi:hypothetical protein
MREGNRSVASLCRVLLVSIWVGFWACRGLSGMEVETEESWCSIGRVAKVMVMVGESLWRENEQRGARSDTVRDVVRSKCNVV